MHHHRLFKDRRRSDFNFWYVGKQTNGHIFGEVIMDMDKLTMDKEVSAGQVEAGNRGQCCSISVPHVPNAPMHVTNYPLGKESLKCRIQHRKSKPSVTLLLHPINQIQHRCDQSVINQSISLPSLLALKYQGDCTSTSGTSALHPRRTRPFWKTVRTDHKL